MQKRIKLFTLWHRIFRPRVAKHRTRRRSLYSPSSRTVLVKGTFLTRPAQWVQQAACGQDDCENVLSQKEQTLLSIRASRPLPAGHTASYSTGAKGFFRFGQKGWYVELRHSASSSAEVKDASSDMAISSHSFTTKCSIKNMHNVICVPTREDNSLQSLWNVFAKSYGKYSNYYYV